MARTRKPRPSFEVPATPAAGAAVAPGWVYRTGADAPPAPAKPPDPSPSNSLVSDLTNVVLLPVRISLLPVAIGLVAVLVPLSFLAPRWRR